VSVYWIPVSSPGKLAIVARPRGGDWLRDELQALCNVGIRLIVSALTDEEQKELSLSSEAETARECGLEFISFPIADRGVPVSPSSLRKLANNVVQQLSTGKSVGIHCRASIGRASLIAGAVLAQLKVSPGQIFELISKCRGCTVPDTDDQRRWFETYSTDKP
jgi:protein tyrosine phosphatase (PTP) superfamily phosphohydrolase (DUF442 family)